MHMRSACVLWHAKSKGWSTEILSSALSSLKPYWATDMPSAVPLKGPQNGSSYRLQLPGKAIAVYITPPLHPLFFNPGSTAHMSRIGFLSWCGLHLYLCICSDNGAQPVLTQHPQTQNPSFFFSVIDRHMCVLCLFIIGVTLMFRRTNWLCLLSDMASHLNLEDDLMAFRLCRCKPLKVSLSALVDVFMSVYKVSCSQLGTLAAKHVSPMWLCNYGFMLNILVIYWGRFVCLFVFFIWFI